MKDELLRLLDAVPLDEPLAAAARKAAALLRDTPVVEIGESRNPASASDLARDYALRLSIFRERGIQRTGLAETAGRLASCEGPVRMVYVDCELGNLTLLIDAATGELVGCTFA